MRDEVAHITGTADVPSALSAANNPNAPGFETSPHAPLISTVCGFNAGETPAIPVSASANNPIVQGAVKFLKWLQRYWARRVPDEGERLKFILASYNCGAGHVEDAQRLTRSTAVILKYGMTFLTGSCKNQPNNTLVMR